MNWLTVLSPPGWLLHTISPSFPMVLVHTLSKLSCLSLTRISASTSCVLLSLNDFCSSLIAFPRRLTLRTENPSNPLLVTYSSTKSSPAMAVSTSPTNLDLALNLTPPPSLCPIRASSHLPRVWVLLEKLRMMRRGRLMASIKLRGER